MNKEEIVAMMVESFKNDNTIIALNAGMPQEEIDEKFENSKHSISFMLSNVYDKLAEKDLLK